MRLPAPMTLAALSFLLGAGGSGPTPREAFTEASLPRSAPAFEWGGAGSPLLFEDIADEMGLTASITATWGAAWSDADGDGRLDLYLGRHGDAPPSLFLNRDSFFEDRGGILAAHTTDRHGPAFGDLENDGDRDLYVTTGAGPGGAGEVQGELYVADPEGPAEQAEIRGVAHAGCRGRGAAWLDHDGDGDLDLLSLCAPSTDGVEPTLFDNRGDGTFLAEQAGVPVGVRYTGGIFPADLDDDGDLDLLLTAATIPDEDHAVFLLDEGDGYRSAAAEVGLGGLTGARGAAWLDCDGDGDLDLYVGRGANFRGNGPDGWTWLPERPAEVGWLLRGDGPGDLVDAVVLTTDAQILDVELPTVPPFVETPPRERVFLGPGLEHPATIPFVLNGADPDLRGRPSVDPRDAAPGLYLWIEAPGRWVIARVGREPAHETAGRITADRRILAVAGFQLDEPPWQGGDRLYRNDGGTLVDISEELPAGARENRNTGPVAAGDFDNDGDPDLVALHGDHLGSNAGPWLGLRNDGACRFHDVSSRLGLPRTPLSRKATLVTADYDDDGDLDLWVSNEVGPAPFGLGPYLLLRNRGTGNRGLTLRLVGTRSNRDGIGARVSVRTGERRQVRHADNGASLYSQNDPRLHFGLGGALRADRVTVRWPSGRVQELVDVEGPVVTIVEPDS